jgi:hypothetical protein
MRHLSLQGIVWPGSTPCGRIARQPLLQTPNPNSGPPSDQPARAQGRHTGPPDDCRPATAVGQAKTETNGKTEQAAQHHQFFHSNLPHAAQHKVCQTHDEDLARLAWASRGGIAARELIRLKHPKTRPERFARRSMRECCNLFRVQNSRACPSDVLHRGG